jgi:hypothetical protein
MKYIEIALVVLSQLFVLLQLFRVGFTDGRYIRSPLQKAVWFLVVLFGNVIGAVVFFVWKRQKTSDVAAETREAESRLVAEAYMNKETAEQIVCGE